jgi:EAL domain-containing protein (putative c-di-GMP-specific phosphodiesterase class I)
MSTLEEQSLQSSAEQAATGAEEYVPHPDHVFTWGERKLHFSLQQKIAGNTLVGFEALLRDLDSNVVPADLLQEMHGSPDEELFHLMLISEVCARAQELHAPVSVNIPPDVLTPDLARRIVDVVRIAGASDALEIELTEDHPISNKQQFDALRVLVDAGLPIALDDYDTGNANEEALRQLEDAQIRLTTVKIDRSHVQLGTAARLAEDLLSRGYHVVVEGVEKEEELTVLPHGCVIQGHIHGRARPARHFQK